MEKTSAGYNPYIQGVVDGIIGGVGFFWNYYNRGEGIRRESEAKGDFLRAEIPFRGATFYDDLTNPFIPGTKTHADEVAQTAFHATACLTVVAQAKTLHKVFGAKGLLAPVVTNLVPAFVRAIEVIIEISNDGSEDATDY